MTEFETLYSLNTLTSGWVRHLLTFCRNMVLQSESLDDDDVEHFEDIVEETENKSEPALLKQPESAVTVVPDNNDGAKIDPDSSDSEEVELSGSDLGSEDNDSDGDDILKRGSNTVGQLKTDGSSGGTQPPNVKLSLPGGYDPRHREPSYWYSLLYFLYRNTLLEILRKRILNFNKGFVLHQFVTFVAQGLFVSFSYPSTCAPILKVSTVQLENVLYISVTCRILNTVNPFLILFRFETIV